MTRTLVRTTAVALAAAALAAPTALARPDAATPVAKPAAPAPHQGLPQVHANRFAERPIIDRSPVQPDRAPASPAAVSLAPTDHGIDWATIGIGVAGSLFALGAIALITDRVRHPHARISA
jgi:hypothetical protein